MSVFALRVGRAGLIPCGALLIIALSFAPLFAQDTPTDPPPDTGGGMDPITTPAPLPTRLPYSLPNNVLRQDGVSVELFFPNMPQGTTALMRVYGANLAGSPINGVRARFLERLIDFFPVDDRGYYGLLSTGMETATGRTYDLSFFVSFADGTRTSLNTSVAVVLGNFISQNVSIPPERRYLLDIETERNELSRLESLITNVTLERWWDELGFQMPILSSLTSPFGAFRTFNSTLNTRHTGWDIRTTLGTPVMASAAGRVAYTGLMEIRGNYVLIDHGYGVYSGYAHLSQVHVTRGQEVTRGQVIGTVGDTGRVSGPHFHWEMAVNGQWVDSVQFIQMWMP